MVFAGEIIGRTDTRFKDALHYEILVILPQISPFPSRLQFKRLDPCFPFAERSRPRAQIYKRHRCRLSFTCVINFAIYFAKAPLMRFSCIIAPTFGRSALTLRGERGLRSARSFRSQEHQVSSHLFQNLKVFLCYTDAAPEAFISFSQIPDNIAVGQIIRGGIYQPKFAKLSFLLEFLNWTPWNPVRDVT